MSVVLLRFKRTGRYYYDAMEILDEIHCCDGGYVRGRHCGVNYIVHPWQERIFLSPLGDANVDNGDDVGV